MTKTSQLAIFGGKPVRKKPFLVFPAAGQPEIAALRESIRNDKWSGHFPTPLHARFEDLLAGFHKTRFAVLTTSGTASLEVAMEACGVKPGDKVIVSPYTCIADAEAILRVGAIPVFGDINPPLICWDVHPHEIQNDDGAISTAKIRSLTQSIRRLHRTCSCDSATFNDYLRWRAENRV